MRTISWVILHALEDLPEYPALYMSHRKIGLWDCRYHYIVRRCGTLVHGRPEALPGIHLSGYDASSVSIAVPQMTGRGWGNPLVLTLADLLQQLLLKHQDASICLASQLDSRTEFPSGTELLERLRQAGLS